jgi:hypothetical protein
LVTQEVKWFKDYSGFPLGKHLEEHIGWFGEGSAEYYSRLPALVELDFVAGRLAVSVKDA